MFKKWILKKGPGSVGESAKLLANNYLAFTGNSKPSSNSFAFEQMFEDRKALNRRFPADGDLIAEASFQNLLQQFVVNDKEREDLPLFIFKLLFFESGKFRSNLQNLGAKDAQLILEVIYEMTSEVAPYGITLSKDEFLAIMER